MFVYGDVLTRIDLRAFRDELSLRLDGISRQPAGLYRHAALADLFVDLQSLTTILLDAAMPDRDDRPDARLMAPLMAVARALDSSFQSGYRRMGDLTPARAALQTLPAAGPGLLKPPEGHSFYALYPEALAEAARQSRLGRDTLVIGIRSIGTGLAAMVATALDAPPPVTVRPRGHPFSRTVSLSPRLDDEITRSPGAIAIVDEGPGLSGSSFGGVLDRLEAIGIARHRLHLFPSHPGAPGAAASATHLSRWRALPRHVVGVDDILVASGRLAAALSDTLGPLVSPLEDFGGGRWRPPGETDLDSVPLWERRKWRAATASGRYLVKFSGLGREGQEKFRLAQHLWQKGLVPEPVTHLHGFLITRWIDAPRLGQAPLPRAQLIDGLARYLATRAAVAAGPMGGASLDELVDFARANTSEALGDMAAERLDHMVRPLLRYAGAIVPVWVDGRLHPAEWLATSGGLVKTDAYDHARNHTPLGAQDIAYDVAGAVVEHRLTSAETEALLAALSARGATVSRELLALYRPIYLGLELGHYTMGLGPDSAPARRAADRLRELIRSGSAPS